MSVPDLVRTRPQPAAHRPPLTRDVAARVDENARHAGVVVGVAAQQQHASPRRDGDADLVSQLEPAASLPVLLAQKYLDEALELLPVGGRQSRKRRHVPRDYCAPFGGKWPRAKSGAAASSEETGHRSQ